jgi:hypothetical protein
MENTIETYNKHTGRNMNIYNKEITIETYNEHLDRTLKIKI